MTYFPKGDERPKAEECPGCGEWYIPQSGPVYIGCKVLHAPGTCCHVGETKVEIVASSQLSCGTPRARSTSPENPNG